MSVEADAELVERAVDDALREPGAGAMNGLGATGGAPPEQERDPDGWARVVLLVSPTGNFYAIGGERAPGDPRSDRPYTGKERLDQRIDTLAARLAELRTLAEFDVCVESEEGHPGSIHALDAIKLVHALRTERDALREALEALDPLDWMNRAMKEHRGDGERTTRQLREHSVARAVEYARNDIRALARSTEGENE